MPCKPCEREYSVQRADGTICMQRCGAPVSGGGNVHALYHCPAPPNPKGNREARKRIANAAKRRREAEAAKLQAIADERAARRAAEREKAA